MRLQCEVIRAGQTDPEQSYDVLNELVIDRGPNAFLTNIECWEKGRFITRVQADGIMLSTPTGECMHACTLACMHAPGGVGWLGGRWG
jgi:NAD+ kinase